MEVQTTVLFRDLVQQTCLRLNDYLVLGQERPDAGAYQWVIPVKRGAGAISFKALPVSLLEHRKLVSNDNEYVLCLVQHQLSLEVTLVNVYPRKRAVEIIETTNEVIMDVLGSSMLVGDPTYVEQCAGVHDN